MNAREASESLYATLTKKETRGLVSVEVNDLPNRQPPSAALVVLLRDKRDAEDLPSDWMGYHVSHRVEAPGEHVGLGVINPRGLSRLKIER